MAAAAQQSQKEWALGRAWQVIQCLTTRSRAYYGRSVPASASATARAVVRNTPVIATVAIRRIALNGHPTPKATTGSFGIEHHADAAYSVFEATVELTS